MDQKDGQKLDVALPPGRPSTNGDQETYCPICGQDGDLTLKRFGQLFCSEVHVEQYASERRANADLTEAAPAALATTKQEGKENAPAMACGIGTKGGLRKMGWCIAGGVGLLVALPLIASGGLAAAAGSVLSVAAFLACPIGMYFMMRGMMKTNQKGNPDDKAEGK